MPRYIDADLLMQKAKSRHGNAPTWVQTGYVTDTDIRCMPTADVQPVVHCKNCKYCVDNQACKRAYQGRCAITALDKPLTGV